MHKLYVQWRPAAAVAAGQLTEVFVLLIRILTFRGNACDFLGFLFLGAFRTQMGCQCTVFENCQMGETG